MPKTCGGNQPVSDARALRREAKEREVRAVRSANATEAIGTLEPGCELFILTYGQFSLMDAVSALLAQTGPADVVLSTWTAGSADLTRCANLLEGAGVTSFRMVVDRSFLTRQPGYCRKMVDLFGSDCIRTWRGHAKFALIRNERWNLAVRTSMNLNTNPRMENLEISDDQEFAGFFGAVVDEVFREQEPGVMDGELPKLAAVDFADKRAVTTGKASAAPMPQTELRA